jgi:hypothetical protein
MNSNGIFPYSLKIVQHGKHAKILDIPDKLTIIACRIRKICVYEKRNSGYNSRTRT